MGFPGIVAAYSAGAVREKAGSLRKYITGAGGGGRGEGRRGGKRVENYLYIRPSLAKKELPVDLRLAEVGVACSLPEVRYTQGEMKDKGR